MMPSDLLLSSYPVDTEAKEKCVEEQLLLSCFTPCMYTSIVCNNFSLYYVAIIIPLTLPCVHTSLCKVLNVIRMWAAVKLLVSVQIAPSFDVKMLKFTFFANLISYSHVHK